MRKISFFILFLLCAVTLSAQTLEIKSAFVKEPYASVLSKYANEFREHEMPDMPSGLRFPYAVVCVKLQGNGGDVAAAKRFLSLDLGAFPVQERVTDLENMVLFLVPSSVARVQLTCGDGCSGVRILDLPCLESNAVYSGTVHFVPYREEKTDEKVDREQLKQELLAEIAGMLKEQGNTGGNQLVSSQETAVSTQSVVSQSTHQSQSVLAPSQPMMHNGHEYVDLGLSVKWATCNVGANKPEDYGDYFAWGETEPKITYDWSTYKWCNGDDNDLTKYCTRKRFGYNRFVDDKITLLLSDDAAHANWGGSWRMPTRAEQDELHKKCKWKWTTQNGVNGFKVTSKSNGNSIFLPAAGFRKDSSLLYAGSFGHYWPSSLITGKPIYAYFSSSNVLWSGIERRFGLSVRPVCP